MPELSGATKSSREETSPALGCQKEQLHKLRANPPCCGPGAGGSLGYHTEHSGTLGSCPERRHRGCGSPARSLPPPGGPARHGQRFLRFLRMHKPPPPPAREPGPARGASLACLGCTNVLRQGEPGTSELPGVFGKTPALFLGPTGSPMPECDTCELEIIAPHRW